MGTFFLKFFVVSEFQIATIRSYKQHAREERVMNSVTQNFTSHTESMLSYVQLMLYVPHPLTPSGSHGDFIDVQYKLVVNKFKFLLCFIVYFLFYCLLISIIFQLKFVFNYLIIAYFIVYVLSRDNALTLYLCTVCSNLFSRFCLVFIKLIAI